MWKAKLCLSIMGLAPTVPEEIKLFSDAGFDGFFTGWSEGVDFASYHKAADEYGMYWQSVHAPFLKAKDM